MPQKPGVVANSLGLGRHGIFNIRQVHWNLATPLLYEEAIRRHEACLAHLGPLVVRTGQYTGRSPRDKYLVREPSSADRIAWGDINQPLEPEHFERLQLRLLAYLQGRDLFVEDCFAGAAPEHHLPVRIITETAWHSLFARNLFIQAAPADLEAFEPGFTLIHAPNFRAIPKMDQTHSEVFIGLNFGARLVLICGTPYAGEIKKSIFTVMNDLLPGRGVLTMHAAANAGERGDVAIFFGLSGTGKTALATDSSRLLLGDDELGWSDRGVFNIEGGCYAKVIRLSRTAEPEIYETTRRFGTVLENVAMDSLTGRLDLDDDSLTENSRAAYPISHISGSLREGMAGHASCILMLTADAFGVLPPIAKLTPAQALYHFLSGYTAKLAGTERGLVRPRATFSPCFGAPFMPRSPMVYARLLGEKLERHQVKVWLVNTGWSGGPYGLGQRIPIAMTRAMVRAAISGALDHVPTRLQPDFGLAVPTACPGVPGELLDARGQWADKAAYDAQAQEIVKMFAENAAAFGRDVPEEVRAAGPRGR